MSALLFLASGYVQSRCDSGVSTLRDRISQSGGRFWIRAEGSCGLGPQPSSTRPTTTPSTPLHVPHVALSFAASGQEEAVLSH